MGLTIPHRIFRQEAKVALLQLVGGLEGVASVKGFGAMSSPSGYRP